MFLTSKRKQTHFVWKSFSNPHFKIKCCSIAWSSFSLPWRFSPSCAKGHLLQMCGYLAPYLAHSLPGNELLKLCTRLFQHGRAVYRIAYWRGAKHLRLRLWDCSGLLNPPDQRFDGTDTSFRLGGLGGVPEFRRCSSVQVVSWTVCAATPAFRRQL